MSIEVKNITKLYGKQKALDNVCFNIKAGEIVGFLGPNGAGKTTMMKILTCFLPPTSGDASVCGFNIYDEALEIKKRMGYLPETNPLYTDMYVKEYLSFIASIHKLGKNSKGRVDEMIRLTGLQNEKHKKIEALSKGYRQRLGLAQALIHNPEVLILDEPTSGLDPNQIVEIRSLIKNISLQKTIMLSTHIMREVEVLCDRVIIINKGKIVADKTISELQNSIQAKSYIITIQFDKDIDKKILNQVNHIKQLQKKDDAACEITVDSAHDIRAELFKLATKNNLTILSLHKEENSIEDIFHSLTKE